VDSVRSCSKSLVPESLRVKCWGGGGQVTYPLGRLSHRALTILPSRGFPAVNLFGRYLGRPNIVGGCVGVRLETNPCNSIANIAASSGAGLYAKAYARLAVTDFSSTGSPYPRANVPTGSAKAKPHLLPECGQTPTRLLLWRVCLAEHKQLQVMLTELREMA
jgi:hypothetical protein